MKVSPWNLPILAQSTGYVQPYDAHKIGILAMTLGAGRLTKESPIDLGAGVVLAKKAGEWVEKGEPILQLYGSTQSMLNDSLQFAQSLVSIDSEPPELSNLIEKVIQ